MSKYRYTDSKKQHLHELDKENGEGYKPLIGTTTALNEVFPPPLAWWASAQALQRFGWITEKNEPDAEKRKELLAKGQDEVRLAADMNLEDYEKLLESCYRAHDEYKKSKGKAGVDKHAQIEGYIKILLSEHDGKPAGTVYANPDLKDFVDWATKDVDRFLWSEAHTFSEKLWLGGITDFGFIHKNGKVIVGDVKPSIYPKNFIQTALYGIQIKENGLCDANGQGLVEPMPVFMGRVDGYCIFDYNKGVAKYRTDVERLEGIGRMAIDLYKHKDVVGSPTL